MAAMIFSRMALADYVALAPSAQRQLVRSLNSVWFMSLYNGVVFAWLLADVMTFFALDDRRALHDRVAGTIVVHKVPLIVGRTDAQQPPASTSAMR